MHAPTFMCPSLILLRVWAISLHLHTDTTYQSRIHAAFLRDRGRLCQSVSFAVYNSAQFSE